MGLGAFEEGLHPAAVLRRTGAAATGADRQSSARLGAQDLFHPQVCEWSNYLAHLDRAIWRYPRLVTTLRRAHTAACDRPGRPM